MLRTTRRSLGSQKEKYSASRNSAHKYISSPSQLEQVRRPDARASIYSYAIYPISTQTTIASSQKHDVTSNASSSSLESPIHPTEIIENSICFDSAYKRLEITAKQASRLPIPEDDDDFGVHVEEDDNGTLISGESDFIVATQPSTVPFIPSEAFSKLGESLEINSDVIAECKDNIVCESLTKNDSDDESIIPGESFMQLGASMVANDLVLSLDNDEHTEENLDRISNTTNYSSASQSFPDAIPSEQTNSKVSNHGNFESTDCDCGSLERKRIMNEETAASETNVDETKIKPCEEGEFSRTVVKMSTNIDGETKLQIPKLLESNLGSVGAETVENLNLSIHSGAATGDVVRQTNKTPKKSNLSVSGCNHKGTHDVVGVRDEEENYQESHTHPEVNSEITPCENTSETKQNPRRNRKKKKKANKPYYPSSRMFVSRHFFSR